jgi:hypothetical protein
MVLGPEIKNYCAGEGANYCFVLLHGAEQFLRSHRLFICLRISVLCSQVPTIGPHPEPDESSPYNLKVFL